MMEEKKTSRPVAFHGLAAVMAVALITVSSVAVNAETVKVLVTSGKGKPVNEAVVYATPVSGAGGAPAAPEETDIDQVDKEFLAHVTPVRVGTPVNFPNHDKIRHHVYSFSPVKTFEIPLYTGTPRDPTVFDKTGAVSLGCNIHDWMSAYVYIVDSPYFAITGEDGSTSLNAPPGDYEVRVWHPRLRGPVKATARKIAVAAGEEVSANVIIKLKKVWTPRRGPTMSRAGGGGYR